MRKSISWGIGIALAAFGLLGLFLYSFTFGLGSSGSSFSSGWGSGIAILELKGPIIEADDFLKSVKKVSELDRAKGVVVRIDSPGGAVGASQEIYMSLKRLGEKKPVYASFGNVAASGGYYAALGAQKIYSLPGSITASIGVRMSHLDAHVLIERLGLQPDVLKSGAFKDVGAMHRPMRADERELLEHLLTTMHQQFKNAVATERKLPIEKVDLIADGRVVVGAEALEAGLVDEIGDLYSAVSAVGELVGLGKDPEIISIEDEKSWWQELFSAKILAKISQTIDNTVKNITNPSIGFYWSP